MRLQTKDELSEAIRRDHPNMSFSVTVCRLRLAMSWLSWS
jgi:hypothetical protein